MRRNGHKTTSGVKFYPIFKVSCQILYMMRNFGNWTTISGIYSQFFCCTCAEAAIMLLPVKFLPPNLKFPWAVYYSVMNFGGASAKIYKCFAQKMAFVMQNFWNLEAIGGGGKQFLTKPPKGTSFVDFTHFAPLTMQIRSRIFALGVCTKKGTLQKDTERLYFTHSWGIPHPTKFN